MKSLYQKLHTIQSLELSVSKNGTNPHFKSKYPTLDNVIDVLTPHLNKNCLLVTHFASWDTFTTRVVDTESWEHLDSTYAILWTTPQQKGSEQTYFRRYSMFALFNIPCEDDDWNGTSNPPPQKEEPKPWINDNNIKDMAKAFREWQVTASSADELVKLARTKYAVSKESEEKIREEYKKVGL